MNGNAFDPRTHTYTIAGRPVPNVTQILDETLPGAIWKADQYFLGRGQAIHACAALIAKGKPFKHDPAIDGQVRACRKFFAEIRPEIHEVEQPLYSEAYNFAGTPDLICMLNGKKCVVDFKSSLADVVFLQLGGYGILKTGVTHGIGVELREDEKYKCTELVKVNRLRNEFLACLTVFNIRKRLGLIKSKEVIDGK